MSDDLKVRLSKGMARLCRSRSENSTENFGINRPLGPNLPNLNVTTIRVETLRPDMPIPLEGGVV